MKHESYCNIPTEYNGVRFRSRLEATWAHIFDNGKIKWEYEPIDLPGWIPDFVLDGETKLYVEIKPIRDGSFELEKRLYSYRKQIDGQILILGDFISPNKLDVVEGFADEDKGPLATSGWILDSTDDDDPINDCLMEDGLTMFDPIVWTRIDGQLDCAASYGHWGSRLTGLYEGDASLLYYEPLQLMTERWKKARNAVQWQRPK